MRVSRRLDSNLGLNRFIMQKLLLSSLYHVNDLFFEHDGMLERERMLENTVDM